jgi:hypothetical protein
MFGLRVTAKIKLFDRLRKASKLVYDAVSADGYVAGEEATAKEPMG